MDLQQRQQDQHYQHLPTTAANLPPSNTHLLIELRAEREVSDAVGEGGEGRAHEGDRGPADADYLRGLPRLGLLRYQHEHGIYGLVAHLNSLVVGPFETSEDKRGTKNKKK